MGNFMSFNTAKVPGEDRNYAGRTPVPFGSKEEMVLWLSDPRYRRGYDSGIDQRDPAYIRHCEARLGLTDDHFTGAGRDLSGAEHTPEYQDPLNTLGGMSDVYRDTSEVRRDQGAPLYKESAFERQRVAEKIGRSVPDEAVHFDQPCYSVQTGGREEGEGE